MHWTGRGSRPGLPCPPPLHTHRGGGSDHHPLPNSQAVVANVSGESCACDPHPSPAEEAVEWTRSACGYLPPPQQPRGVGGGECLKAGERLLGRAGASKKARDVAHDTAPATARALREGSGEVPGISEGLHGIVLGGPWTSQGVRRGGVTDLTSLLLPAVTTPVPGAHQNNRPDPLRTQTHGPK